MPNSDHRIRIAIQKKGRLGTASKELLKQCGVSFNIVGERLVVHSDNLPIDLLLVRDDDIPGLVMDGLVDMGIVGENELQECSLERSARHESCDYEQLKLLSFGHCRLSIAIARETGYQGIQDLQDQRIATSYPHLLKQFLTSKGLSSKICVLSGSVEVAPKADLADGICDLVSTGATLEANGLKECEVIMRSSAVLIKRVGAFKAEQNRLIDRLLKRIQGVLQAKESKYIMLHVPLNRLDEVKALLPGAENPTVMPLANDSERVAVHLVSKENLFWETMEELKTLGASSILILPVEKMME